MKRLFIITVIIIMAGPVWGSTYFVKSGGTAADKAAAIGPCTDLSACMNHGVYAGETFSEGDVITFCKGPIIVPIIRGPHASIYTIPATPTGDSWQGSSMLWQGESVTW